MCVCVYFYVYLSFLSTIFFWMDVHICGWVSYMTWQCVSVCFKGDYIMEIKYCIAKLLVLFYFIGARKKNCLCYAGVVKAERLQFSFVLYCNCLHQRIKGKLYHFVQVFSLSYNQFHVEVT